MSGFEREAHRPTGNLSESTIDFRF